MSNLSKLFTYVGVAIVAGVAGFGAVYVTLTAKGNAGAQQSPLKEDNLARTSTRSRNSITSPATKVARAATPTSLKGLNRGAMAAFLVRASPTDIAEVKFRDASGNERGLSEWRGKVVLLNLWATWCAPCRKEMPDLDRLKSELGGSEFDVVAISIDKGSIDRPKGFLEKAGVQRLELFQDSSTRINATLRAFGMPTTLLIGRDGLELGRLVGPAKWDSPEAIRLIRAAIELTG